MSFNPAKPIQPSLQTILKMEVILAVANDLRQDSSCSTFWSSDC